MFPYESWRGSWSNGVQSLEVPSERRPLPSPLEAVSWFVSSRGLRWWRRVAPFSPRAGHAQTTPIIFLERTRNHLITLRVLIGGRNATHRMNDVWLYVDDEDRVGHWRRLPDAPFSPRSDAIAYRFEQGGDVVALIVLGGQTDDACGLHELGVCSNEVWRAWLNTNETLEADELRLTWTTTDAPHALLPFAARCDAAFDSQSEFGYGHLIVLGGQLSYNDSTCRTAPLYSNDVWYSPLQVTSSSWRQGADAPFSPRRGMQADSRFVLDYRVYVGWLGGLRYLNLSFDAALSRSRLTSAVLHADVWMCNAVLDSDEDYECQFGWTGEDGETLPVASLPFARAGSRFASQAAGPQVGGVVSAASAQRWKATLPKYWQPATSPPPYNVSVMLQRSVASAEVNGTWPTRQQQDDDRFHLPWSELVGEAELNDPEGSFALGSEWVVTVDKSDFTMTTAYEMAGVMTDSPADPSPYLYQAASSENTTRALFNFSLRRLEHRGGAVFGSLVSGGRSGAVYFNDWIAVREWVQCAPANDSSFARVLGPVSVVRVLGGFFGYFAVGSSVRVECVNASFHWEPPSADPQVDLFCTNAGVWMDLEHFTIRRCVPNTLQCLPPLRDDGLGRCQMPAAVIASIDIDYEGVRRVDEITITALPLNQVLQLTVRGAFFQQPLTVTVGGQDCLLPELLLGNESLSLCRNHSLNATSPVDCTYADAFICWLQEAFGQRLPVRVWSGPLFENVDVLDRFAGQLATVSTAHPRLLNLTSAACRHSPDSPYRLTDCPVTSDFDVEVWLDGDSVLVDDTQVLLDALTPLQCAFEHNSTFCPYRPNYPCVRAVCHVFPTFGEHLVRAVTADGSATATSSGEPSSLSFQSCAAGSRNDYRAAMQGNATNLCIPCPAGSSTTNGTNQDWCTACAPGSHSPVEGLATCSPCPQGSFTDSAGATQCTPCSLNSWQHFPGQDRCDVCDLDSYIVYDVDDGGQEANDTSAAQPRSSAHCLPCPFRAQCAANGSIEAQAGAYLLVDQASGTVRSVPCSTTACVGASADSRVDTAADVLVLSQLPVLNWCGRNRLPALSVEAGAFNASATSDAVFVSTSAAASVPNVLCAFCLPQHTEVNGVCVHCPETNGLLLFSSVLLLLAVVYLLHRFPHDSTGSGVLTIGSYFVQLSLTFLASQWMPPMLGVVNLSLLASHRPYGAMVDGEDGGDVDPLVASCVLPLDDYGRMGLQLLSPVIVGSALALIGGTQLVAGRLLSCTTSPLLHRLYRRLFDFDWSGQQSRRDGSGEDRLAEPLMEPTAAANSGGAEAIVQQPPPATPSLLLYQRTAVRLLLLLYSNVALTSLSFFRLQDVGHFGWRVADYPQMDPASSRYAAMTPFVGLVVAVLVCAPPVALLAFLLWHRQRAQQAGLLVGGDDGDGAIVGDGGPTAALDRVDALYRQLTCQFQPTLWWWSVVVLLRRLLIAAVLVLVHDTSVWVWLSFCNFSILAAHARLWPYARRRDNRTELLCLFSLALQTTLLSAYPPPVHSAGLLSSLLLALLLPLVPLFAFTTSSLLQLSSCSAVVSHVQ